MLKNILTFSDREEHSGRHSVMNGGRDTFLLNSSTAVAPILHHTPWTPFSKENVKFKNEDNYSKEEPFSVFKDSLGGQKPADLDTTWSPRGSYGPLCTGHGVNLLLAGRVSKHAHYGKPYKISPVYYNSTTELYIPKIYGSHTNQEVVEDNFLDSNKSENACYEGQRQVCDAHLIAEVPIKVEQDSDVENEHDFFEQAWTDREHNLSSYDGLQMKAEDSYYEQYIPCQKITGNNGHLFSSQYPNVCGTTAQPLKCVLERDPEYLCPQRLGHLHPLCSRQSANCMDGYNAGSMEHKDFIHQDYKLGYQFKGQGLLHSIKREPMDSPPWHENEYEHIGGQWNMMPNCIMNLGQSKANPCIFMQ